MGSTTCDYRNYSDTWKAECPRCDKPIGPADFVCPNCETASMRVVVDTHSDGPDDCPTFWEEHFFMCQKCQTKTKSFPCPHECGGVVTFARVSAFMRKRYGGHKGCQSMMIICMVIAVFIGWAKYYDMFSLRAQLLGLPQDVAERSSYVLLGGEAAALFGLVLLFRFGGLLKPKRWYRFKD